MSLAAVCVRAVRSMLGGGRLAEQGRHRGGSALELTGERLGPGHAYLSLTGACSAHHRTDACLFKDRQNLSCLGGDQGPCSPSSVALSGLLCRLCCSRSLRSPTSYPPPPHAGGPDVPSSEASTPTRASEAEDVPLIPNSSPEQAHTAASSSGAAHAAPAASTSASVSAATEGDAEDWASPDQLVSAAAAFAE